jgi:hypothetical protein
MDPFLRMRKFLIQYPLILTCQGGVLPFAVVLASPPHFPRALARAEHFAGVHQRGIGDVFSAGHAG